MSIEGKIKDIEKQMQNKRMRVDSVMPNDRDGYDGERRIVKLKKTVAGSEEELTYHTMKRDGVWHRTIAGTDIEYDDATGEVRQIIQIGNKKYKIPLEEVEE